MGFPGRIAGQTAVTQLVSATRRGWFARTLRCLRGDFLWGEEALEKAAKLTPGSGRAFAKALEAEGLIRRSRCGGWTITQAGDPLAVATAARPVSRAPDRASQRVELSGNPSFRSRPLEKAG